MFKIIQELNKDYINIDNLTAHCNTRYYRIPKCTKVVKCFLVDKNHKNGLEEHFILEDASIVVVNHKSQKVVTILKARLGQLKRYNFKISHKLKNFSLINEEFGLNNQ